MDAARARHPLPSPLTPPALDHRRIELAPANAHIPCWRHIPGWLHVGRVRVRQMIEVEEIPPREELSKASAHGRHMVQLAQFATG